MLSPCLNAKALTRKALGLALVRMALAGLTAPVGVALLLVAFLGGTDPASTPYLAPGCGLRVAFPGSRLLSHPGKRSSSRATDDLLYPATARGALHLPSRACCKILSGCARWLGPVDALVCCRWVNYQIPDAACQPEF